MQKSIVAFTALILIFLVVVSSVALIAPTLDASSHPFYVGVTYCGDSVDEAKQLIDKVKDYTNLFVLQSGSIMQNVTAMQEIGDYAVHAGLKVTLYYATNAMVEDVCASMVNMAQERWKSSFLGLYFNDEPGGRMLDRQVKTLYYEGTTNSTITIYPYFVTVTLSFINQLTDGNFNNTMLSTTFYKTGAVKMQTQTIIINPNSTDQNISTSTRVSEDGVTVTIESRTYSTSTKTVTYQPNGTILYSYSNITGGDNIPIEQFIYQPDGTVQDKNGNSVTNHTDISQFEPYQRVIQKNPFGDYAAANDTFTQIERSLVKGAAKNQSVLNVFTSDYALYWFDYKSGYNTVLTQFVGNESRERHIALCRGAAETFGKDWGAIITWKYNQPPYLESGDELYKDLALAYSSGAKYAVVFSYPSITAFGTLTDEHFLALQQFWEALKTNPSSLGKTESKVAYVIPSDYAFGFRSANDTIWGHFPADELSAKIYSDTVALTARYGAGLNILYDGAETASKLGGYSNVYYYNQTVT